MNRPRPPADHPNRAYQISLLRHVEGCTTIADTFDADTLVIHTTRANGRSMKFAWPAEWLQVENAVAMLRYAFDRGDDFARQDIRRALRV